MHPLQQHGHDRQRKGLALVSMQFAITAGSDEEVEVLTRSSHIAVWQSASWEWEVKLTER